MYPSKIIIIKGRTIEKPPKWEKAEFTIEVVLERGDDIEQAKQMCDVLLEAWLRREK